MAPLSVLLVSPDPLARSGLSALLAARPEILLFGEVGPLEAARVAQGAAVVVWDLGAGEKPSLGPGPWTALGAPVVALAADAGQAAQALRAGARGVLPRGASPAELSAALSAVAEGLFALSPGLAGSFLRPPEPPAGGEALTPREQEVLSLLAEGLANKSIAARLGISDHTAKFHVNAILAKLGVESRAEAIVRAARLGLVAL